MGRVWKRKGEGEESYAVWKGVRAITVLCPVRS